MYDRSRMTIDPRRRGGGVHTHSEDIGLGLGVVEAEIRTDALRSVSFAL